MRCGPEFRCTGTPYGQCPVPPRIETLTLFDVSWVIIGGTLVLGALYSLCRCLAARATTPPVVGQPVLAPGGPACSVDYPAAAAYPAYAPHHDGTMSGLVAGLVLGSALSDHDEPPSYAQAVDAGFEADVV